MHSYRRILGLLEINRDNTQLARRAMQLARVHHAQLGFGHIIDYQPGYECDHAPFLTPRQMLEAINRDVTAKANAIIRDIGAQGAEVLLAQGSRCNALQSLIAEWQADLVLIDSANRELLNTRLSCDLLTIQGKERTGILQGIASVISLAF